MAAREVIVLGCASQVPTRNRNHHALFLRWDEFGILFDPGEGTQRQMIKAGISAHQITHIAITHFHGDHCLGLAGMIQRISLDRVPHVISILYPATGQVFFERLRYASAYFDAAQLTPTPISIAGSSGQRVAELGSNSLYAAPLDHGLECYGYRLEEADGHTMLPDRLKERQINGRAIGQLLREKVLERKNGPVYLDEVSVPRNGQVLSLVMDTRPCDGARWLARNADLLISESTYLSSEENEAHQHLHMTAAQAAALARDAGARQLLLTHFSQRYEDLEAFGQEARTIFPEVVVGDDLTPVPVPPRPDSRVTVPAASVLNHARGRLTLRSDRLLPRHQVVALYASVGWTLYSQDPDSLMHAIEHSSIVHSIWQGSRLVGLLRALTDERTIFYVQDLLVDPEFSNHGIGSFLVQTSLRPFPSIRQQVVLTDNTPELRRFYERLGFEVVGEQHLSKLLAVAHIKNAANPDFA